MNKAILVGNLTRDPELMQSSSGVAYCKFSIAVNRRYANSNGERQTDFFNITAWRGQAESCAKYLKKGSKVLVEAEIHNNNYEKDGITRYNIDFLADRVLFLSRTQAEGGAQDEYKQEEDAPKKKSTPIIDENDDLPF